MMDWSSFFLFQDLSPRQLGIIEPHVQAVEYNAGEVLMRQGDPGEFMLLISDGSVDIYRNEVRLTSRGTGDVVGLMALMEGCPRSATVVAGKKGAQAFKIDEAAWGNIMLGEIRGAVLHNYLIYQQNTIRSTDNILLEEARGKLHQEHMRVLSAQFFVQMVIGLIVFTFALGWLKEWAEQVESTYISFGILFVYAVWSLTFLRQSALPREAFGLTMDNFREAIRLNLPATAIFIAGMFILKWGQVTWYPDIFGTELIQPYQNPTGVPIWVLMVLYSMHALMQEFIARGCIQGGLHQFITGKWAAPTAICLATMMFSVFHLMLDMRLALMTILPSLFWGFLFYSNRNLLAVGISHVLVGIVAFFVLGLV